MSKHHLLHSTYLFNFFFALHSFALVYVHSSLLTRAVGETLVGVVYAVAALLTIATLSIVPRILKNVGDVRFTLICVVIEILAALGLAFSGSAWLIIPLFIIHTIAVRSTFVDLDIFLESATKEDETGVVRGSFLTIGNIALVIAPILVGLLLGNGEAYGKIYLFASALLIPAVLIISLSFKHFRDPRYIHVPLSRSLKHVWSTNALRRICSIDWLLRFFYAWMVIYMPLYLHNYIGLPWEKIGVIFTVMLIPFALFELPLGALADKFYGEKELLIIGLAILGGTTLALSFIESSSFLVWMVALFATRVGASIVEVMSETYFFKQIHEHDTDSIGFFRSIEPLAYIIAPLCASLMLLILPMSTLFIVLGFLVLAGIPIATRLHDTL